MVQEISYQDAFNKLFGIESHCSIIVKVDEKVSSYEIEEVDFILFNNNMHYDKSSKNGGYMKLDHKENIEHLLERILKIGKNREFKVVSNVFQSEEGIFKLV